MAKKESLFVRNKATDLVENKEAGRRTFGNKPTVCVPRSCSEKGTTIYSGHLEPSGYPRYKEFCDTREARNSLKKKAMSEIGQNNPNFGHLIKLGSANGL